MDGELPLFRAKIYSFDPAGSKKSASGEAVFRDIKVLRTWHAACLVFET
jgi:hypothetical protein